MQEALERSRLRCAAGDIDGLFTSDVLDHCLFAEWSGKKGDKGVTK